MRRADDGLRAEMTRRLKPLGFEISALESGGTVGGLPDCTWLHAASGRCGWIEMKATDGWAVTFRPHQLGWTSRRCAAVHGDPVAVAVRGRGVGSGLGAGDALWLFSGHAASLLAAEGMQVAYAQRPDWLMGRWAGAPRLWDWPAVAAALLKS